MSIEVALDDLFDQIGSWGFCYLLTVSDDERTHLLALNPTVAGEGGARVFRFDVGGGRGFNNASARPRVTLVFPPAEHSGGYSLVVDGDAAAGDSYIEVRPTWAVLHRPAP